MPSVLTFAQLVEEEPALIRRLADADLWARWAYDDPLSPRFEAAPISEFIAAHEAEIALDFSRVVTARQRHMEAWERARDAGDRSPLPHEVVRGGAELHIGIKAAICAPRFNEVIVEEGGFIKPSADFVTGTVVGATPRMVRSAWTGNPFLLYQRPRLRDDGALVQSNMVLEAGFIQDGKVQRHAEDLIRPLASGVKWMRRKTPHTVVLVGASYGTRATEAAALACASGLRIRAG
jgi:hypothetical protein